MGVIWTTTKIAVAILIIYAMALVVDSDFGILGTWFDSILTLSNSGRIPSEVWGMLLIVGFLVGGKLLDDFYS